VNPPPFSSHEDNPILSLAALFEGNFSLDWIIELSGQKASQVLSVLEDGTQQGWLEKQVGGFFVFRDLKVQKAWKERLSLKEKQSMHRQIAELLLKEIPDDPINIEAVARHLLHIQNDLNGCRWLLYGADYMRKTFSFPKALRYYTKILGDLYEIRGSETDALFIETAIKYARISIAREDSGKVLSILKEAMIRAQKSKRPIELSLIKMHLAKNEFLQAHYSSAVKHFEEGWALIKDVEEPKVLLSATAFRIFSHFWQGHLKEALRTYEESVPAIEKFPRGEHPILATGVVGFCYAQTGQLTQGLGMLNALRKHCLEKGDHFLAGDVEVTIAGIMIELRRADEALSYLENYKSMTDQNDWNQIRSKFAFALAYYLKGKKKEAIRYFNDWLKRRQEINVPIILNVFWFELCKAMEEGKFPRLGEIHLEEEVRRFVGCENSLMKGVAYRYQAFLQERGGQSHKKIIESLNRSSQWLEESGHLFERCRTYLELMRQHSLIGEEKTGHEIGLNISKMLGSFSQEFIPDDLQWFSKKLARDWESLCDEILKLSQDISNIRDQKKLMQRILSTANRITGAERGAIFSIERDGDASQIRLKATKNITSAQVSNRSFDAVMKMIEEVAASCKGRIKKISTLDAPDCPANERILSQICVPMLIRNKVVGILYHDNSLFVNSFKESDLKLLGYFATQAAIALDHAEAYEEIQRLNQRLNQEKQYYKEQSFQSFHFDDIVGKSPGILQVLNRIDQVANTETTVLILGETGVGKDLVAQALHRHSSRCSQPFIKVLCSALPESLIPSELFGHEKGAFTGSVHRRIGRFELADGGTLFLDEIGDLQLEVQTRLLQVLQSKEFERVGGSETIRSDFRLVTATNRDLVEAIKNKRFRSDLYYRLNVFPLYVLPLRERREDIPPLAHHFLKIYATKMGKTFDGISKDEMKKLMQYNWPGNIRELESIIERGTVLSPGPHFRVPELGVGHTEFTDFRADSTLEEMERFHILRTLQKTGWKVRGHGGAAELLDIHYSTLFFRMKKLGIQRPNEYSRKFNTVKSSTVT
jgi:formate hydrogenlyase transcriptional activator